MMKLGEFNNKYLMNCDGFMLIYVQIQYLYVLLKIEDCYVQKKSNTALIFFFKVNTVYILLKTFHQWESKQIFQE